MIMIQMLNQLESELIMEVVGSSDISGIKLHYSIYWAMNEFELTTH